MRHVLIAHGGEGKIWKNLKTAHVLKHYNSFTRGIFGEKRGELKYFRGALYERRPWIDGITLQQFMETEKDLRARLLVYTKCIQSYVEQSYSRRTFHGDLKPENCLVTLVANPHHAQAIWIDWPAYQKTGFIRHTEKYAAPEKIQQGVDSVSSEIYSLGIIAAEIVGAEISAFMGGFLARSTHPFAWKRHGSLNELAVDWEDCVGAIYLSYHSDF